MKIAKFLLIGIKYVNLVNPKFTFYVRLFYGWIVNISNCIHVYITHVQTPCCCASMYRGQARGMIITVNLKINVSDTLLSGFLL